MKIIPFLGRVFISVIFLFAGVEALLNFPSKILQLEGAGVAAPELFMGIAIALCFAGSLSLILGWRTRFGAFLLILFLVPVTLIMHIYPGELTEVWKNLALLGGLLMVISNGPGKWSVDGETKGA